MQLVTNFKWIKFLNNLLPKKRANCNKLHVPKKQRKSYFYIINIHTQAYITLNKYNIGIASIGKPVGKLMCDLKTVNAAKTLLSANDCMFRAQIYTKK